MNKPTKPHDTAFKQQRIWSFFPTHESSTVAVIMFIVAMVFIPIGASIVIASDSIFELDVRYDTINHCKFPQGYAGNWSGCDAKATFTLSKSIAAPVYIYYRLVGFYQNYRTYQESLYESQLNGNSGTSADTCIPFRYPGENNGASQTSAGISNLKYSDFTYAPCGAVAWSMFNDSIALYKVPDASLVNTSSLALPVGATVVCVGGDFQADGTNTNAQNQCQKQGIALSVDTSTRFKLPIGSNIWTYNGNPASTDPFLSNGYYANETGHKIPLQTDEDFIVWTRSAALPDFRKLYRIITADLVAGDYLVDVTEYFDTSSFQGEKHFVLATRSWIGAQHYVLGIFILVLGCFAFCVGIAVIVLKCIGVRPRQE